jgi:hypothetical protein
MRSEIFTAMKIHIIVLHVMTRRCRVDCSSVSAVGSYPGVCSAGKFVGLYPGVCPGGSAVGSNPGVWSIGISFRLVSGSLI